MGNSYPTGRRAWRLHSAGQPSQDGDAAQAANQGGDGADGALGKAAALQHQRQQKQQLRLAVFSRGLLLNHVLVHVPTGGDLHKNKDRGDPGRGLATGYTPSMMHACVTVQHALPPPTPLPS